jgi:hypothetical protein
MKVHKVFSIFVVLALVMAVVPVLSVGAAGTVIVTPADLNGWFAYDDTYPGGTTNFISGPGAVPAGTGSLQFTLTGSARMLMGTIAYAGTRLDQITNLQYSTYRSSVDAGNLLAVTLQFDMDYDLTDSTTSWQSRLVFEPYFTAGSGNILQNTWDTWTPLTGKWWMAGTPIVANSAVANPCPQSSPCTWNTVLTAFPDAGLRSDVGVLWFKAGGPWTSFDGNVDAFTIGINNDDTTYDFEPTPPNQPPTADPGGPYLGAVNTSIAFDGTGSFDPDNNPLTFAWDFGDGNFGSGSTPSHSYSIPDIYDVCLTVNDGFVDSAEVCTSAVVYDPSGGFVTGGGWIDSPAGAYKLNDRNITSLVWDQDFSLDDAGWLDNDDAWYGDISVAGGTATFHGDSSSAPFSRFDGYRDTWSGTWIAEIDVYLDPAWPSGQGFDYSVAASGSDGAHQRDYIFHVGVVEDYGPITGRALLVNGSNNADFYTNPYKLINDNGGNYYAVTTAGWYTLQHVFRDAGGYLAVDLNLLDSGGNTLWTATRENVADTIPGEVGGNRYSWFTHIDVAYGILVDNHQLFVPVGPTGKATFGFVSKYKKGASIPTGTTEFQFKAGGLNFHSSNYEWLVVNQDGTNAQFKGYGTINGAGNYGFMLWAGDGSPDTFRIKIWDATTEEVVYDNGMDQPIGGGSIVIHKK